MPDDKVIDEEIEDPIEHQIASSAGCVTEELLRHFYEICKKKDKYIKIHHKRGGKICIFAKKAVPLQPQRF